MTGRLENKRALITGAANGMGAEAARLFVKEGAFVAVADIELEMAEQLVAKLGARAFAIKLDVASEGDWSLAREAVHDKIGGLDILVNNAGLFRPLSMLDTSAAEFERLFQVNQLGCFLGMKEMTPLLSRNATSAIVNLSSAAGLRGAGFFGYSATKWAVRGMTKCAALELASKGIRVNSVHPGPIDTRMMKLVAPEANEQIVALTPLGRLGTAREVANLVLFLASDESSYLTGSEVAVDGGISI